MKATRRRRPHTDLWAKCALVLLAAVILIGVGEGTLMVLRPAAAAIGIISQFPANGTSSAPPTTRITASFSQPLDAAAEKLKFVVKGPHGNQVPGALQFNSTLDAATLQPMDRLQPGSYRVEVMLPGSGGANPVVDNWQFQVKKPRDLAGGLGGSLLVIAAPGTRDSFLAEILRAEGLNGFDTVAPDEVTQRVLAEHAVAIVGASSGPDNLADVLQPWVKDGGDLVAIRPRGRLADLAGLMPSGGGLADAYLKVDGSEAPGKGITTGTLQFHGTALLYRPAQDTRSVATLYANATTSAQAPAVTLRDADDLHGHVAAFTYDLATSVLYTRQGNPGWAGQERDGIPPIRPNDLFTGAGSDPDYLDLDKVGIPQADEQMRLLTNTLELLHRDFAPLPRLWYLPHGANVALLLAADDHGTADGTERAFEHLLELDPVGCSVRDWECPRATSWMYPASPMTDAEAATFSRDGFDLGSHVSTECHDWSRDSLEMYFARSLTDFRDKYPSLPAQTGNRLHCIAWSQWTTQPVVERSWGIRLDMNYYNWPPDWIKQRPGYMTGSALPMRFSSNDGKLIDVFQQETHLVNESWKNSSQAIDALISAAQDGRGYYGVLGTHFDFSDDFDRRLMDAATRLNVPMISSEQLLDFTDGRNASTINGVNAESGNVGFQVTVDDRVTGMLQLMLPTESAAGELSSLQTGGRPVPFHTRAIKGIDYAFFTAVDGEYTAAYR